MCACVCVCIRLFVWRAAVFTTMPLSRLGRELWYQACAALIHFETIIQTTHAHSHTQTHKTHSHTALVLDGTDFLLFVFPADWIAYENGFRNAMSFRAFGSFVRNLFLLFVSFQLAHCITYEYPWLDQCTLYGRSRMSIFLRATRNGQRNKSKTVCQDFSLANRKTVAKRKTYNNKNGNKINWCRCELGAKRTNREKKKSRHYDSEQRARTRRKIFLICECSLYGIIVRVHVTYFNAIPFISHSLSA